MLKKTVYVIATLCFLLLATGVWIITSPAQVIRILNQGLIDEFTQITCLDYSLEHFPEIRIDRLCVNRKNLSVNARNMDYHAFRNTLDAGTVSVNIAEFPQDPQRNNTPLNLSFSLPAILPQSTIDRLVVQSTGFPNSVELSLKQVGPNHFSLTQPSDSQHPILTTADIRFNNDEIVADVIWQADMLSAMLSAQYPQLSTLNLSAAQVKSTVNLHGNELNTMHVVTFNSTPTLSDCQAEVAGQGQITFNYSLSTYSGVADMTGLRVQTKIAECPNVSSLLNKREHITLTLALPSLWLIDENRISTDIVTVKSVDTEMLSLKFSELSISAGESLALTLQAKADHGPAGRHEATMDLELMDKNLTFSGELYSSEFARDSISIKAVNGQIKGFFNLADKIAGQGNLAIETRGVNAEKVRLNSIDTDLTFNWQDNQQITLSGASAFDGLSMSTLPISTPGRITHTITADLSEMSTHSEHLVQLPSELALQIHHHMDAKSHLIKGNIPVQEAFKLNPFIKKWHANLSGGNLSAQGMFDVNTKTGGANLSLQNLNSEFKEYKVQGLSFSPQLVIDSGNLQLPPAKVTIESIDAGILISQVTASLSDQANKFKLEELRADLLGGQVSVEQAWLDSGNQTVTLKFRELDLQSIMNTQQEAGIDSSGIELSGKLNGDVPVTVKNGKISIALASLINSSQGTLKISGNSGFEALKMQQPEIGQQLALLEHVEFETLKSDLTMNSDGIVFFDMKIKGVNPEQQQPINFNYTHEQNIFTLLKALRLADQIEKNIQQNLTGEKQE